MVGVGGGGGRWGGGEGAGGDEGRREFPAFYFKFDPMLVPSWSCCFSNHVGCIFSFLPPHCIISFDVIFCTYFV